MHKIQGLEHKDQSLQVLVVEDDPVTALTMKALLEGKGHHVTLVQEAEDALQALEKSLNPPSRFQVLFLDYHLPKMNGRTFCHILRTSEIGKNYPDLWVIAHTRETRQEVIEQMFASGINDYLPKPIHPETFLCRILVAQYALKR